MSTSYIRANFLGLQHPIPRMEDWGIDAIFSGYGQSPLQRLLETGSVNLVRMKTKDMENTYYSR
jgi:hypothetical protein